MFRGEWGAGGMEEAGETLGSAAYNVSREGFNWIVSKIRKNYISIIILSWQPLSLP